MGKVRLSVIIPVYNQWHLTQNCLHSLASTLPGDFYEVLLMDNASSDETPLAAPALGETLFGNRFHYHRFAVNRNFGPANNEGARSAKGNDLLLLNNDVVLHDGWYPPLTEDFSDYPGIAATSPVLTYPEGPRPSFFGPKVQHLGVYYSPNHTLGHLYEGIPAASPLVEKRRFFQVITAACMLLPRALFLEHGGFDEEYINGFEDVDLCARLYAQGTRLTVNPRSRVEHHTSQTAGRGSHMEHNARTLSRRGGKLLYPDLLRLLQADGYAYQLTPWLTWEYGLLPPTREALGEIPEQDDLETLRTLILNQPYWAEGYIRLFHLLLREGQTDSAVEVWNALIRLFPRPEHALLLPERVSLPRQEGCAPCNETLRSLLNFCSTPEAYAHKNARAQARLEKSAPELAEHHQAWAGNCDAIYQRAMLPVYQRLAELARHEEFAPTDKHAYMLWQLTGQDALHCSRHGLSSACAPASLLLPSVAVSPADDSPSATHLPTFSVLLPASGSEEAIAASVKSLQQQTWPHWELCVGLGPTVEASFKSKVRQWASEGYAIRVCRSPEGFVSMANNALSLAEYDFSVLLRPGDLLSPDALELTARMAQACPQAKLLFSDDDQISPEGELSNPRFKPMAWDAALLRGTHYLGDMAAFHTLTLQELGGWREGYPDAESYDLALRFTETLPREAIIHIPKVLYHRGPARPAGEKRDAAAAKALQQHLKRTGRKGRVVRLDRNVPWKAAPEDFSGLFKILFTLPTPTPTVSIIIDGRAPRSSPAVLAQNLARHTEYPGVEVLVLYDDPTLPPGEEIREGPTKTLRGSGEEAMSAPVLRPIGVPPDMSPAALRNHAARKATGDILCFISPDIMPDTPRWLHELAACLLQSAVGAVAGRVLSPQGELEYLGYVGDTTGHLVGTERGLSPRHPGHMGMGLLTHEVEALDSRIFMIVAEEFRRFGGFDPLFAQAAPLDLCLRMKQAGKRVIILPTVSFTRAAVSRKRTVGSEFRNKEFYERWYGLIPPYIPALNCDRIEGSLHWENPPPLSRQG